MKHLWLLLPAVTLLVSCIDDQYRLDRLDNEARIFKNLQVPIGNTRDILFEDLLGKDPETIPAREDGTYLIQMNTGIEDIGANLSNLIFEEAILSFTVRSTIPLDISINADVSDTEGRPFQTSPIRIESDRVPEIPAGTLSSPSESRVLIQIQVPEDRQIGDVQLKLEGRTPGDKQTVPLAKNQGIRLENINLSIPSGIILSD